MPDPIVLNRAGGRPPGGGEPDGESFLARLVLHVESMARRLLAIEARAPERGEPGAKGDAGRGIESIRLVDGSLVVVLTDGAERDLGRIAANPKDGVGVASATVSDDGVLSIALTDGTVIAAGRVIGRDGAAGPRGERGERGDVGAPGRDGKDLIAPASVSALTDEEFSRRVTSALGETIVIGAK